MAHTEKGNSDMWITSNGGKTFQEVHLPFTLEGALDFHPNKNKADLILTMDHSNRVSMIYHFDVLLLTLVLLCPVIYRVKDVLDQ